MEAQKVHLYQKIKFTMRCIQCIKGNRRLNRRNPSKRGVAITYIHCKRLDNVIFIRLQKMLIKTQICEIMHEQSDL